MRTIIDKYNVSEVTEDMLLPENIDHAKVWTEYINEDPGAICGSFVDKFRSFNEIQQTNAFLYKQLGALNYLAPYGDVLDVGSGLSSLSLLLTEYHKYYPCDVIQHTPGTLVIDGNGSIPFPDKSFDYIYCCNVFQHLHSNIKKLYIKEFSRLLKDNGLLFLTIVTDDLKLGPRIQDKKYAVTNEYYVELTDSNTIGQLLYDHNFRIMSKTLRSDSFVGFWCSKVLEN